MPIRAPAPLRSMRPVDTTGNSRIPVLMEMVGALSRADDPREVLRVFSERSAELYGHRAYVSLSTRGLRPGEYKITRFLTDDTIDLLSAADPWTSWGGLPVHTGGFFGEIIRKAYPELIHHLDLRDDPIVGDKLGEYHSMMAIPLFDNGEPLNWAVFFRREPEGYTLQELEEAILRANLVGTTVRNVLTAKQLREANARIRGEVDQIAAIQRALLPRPLPEIAGVKLATSYETFDTAGGDMYDFTPLRLNGNHLADPTGPWAVLIADASGHGPAAAVVTAMLNAIIYAYPKQIEGPALVLEHANRHLCQKRIENSFVTAFLAVYDPVTRRLRYARAGHNPPLLKNAGSGGAVRRLDDVGGVPLGVLDRPGYDEGEVTLQRDQTLVLYTDGITEARAPVGEMFGVVGIERALTECTGEPECVVNSIGEALREHEAGRRPSDDQTLVAMKIVG